MAKPRYFRGKTRISNNEIPWESVFPIGMTHRCERCGICCIMVELSPFDITKLEKAGLGDQIVYSSPGKPTTKPILKLGPDGFCERLGEDGLCQMYEHRPTVCRSYPLMVTPGFDNDLVIDISLKCPQAGSPSQPKIGRRDIAKSMAMQTRDKEAILKAIRRRNTLAEHIRATYPPAFMERSRKLRFMDPAIGLLKGLKEPVDMIETVRAWSDHVTLASHSVIMGEYEGSVGGKKQDKEILSKMPGIIGISDYSPSKKRWKNVFTDLDSIIFLPEGPKVRRSPVRSGRWSVRAGRESYGWGAFKGLAYSESALGELTDYMKLLIRRVGFQINVAYLAEYLLDYKGVLTVDYALETLLLSNGMMVYLDPLSRLMATINGHGMIEGEDVRLAVCNMDTPFINSLVRKTLVSEAIQRIDSIFG